MATWALVSHILQAVHAKGDTHAAPQANSTHHSSCNPSKNSNVLNSCCSHLGPAVRTLHIYRARAKHPGSNILMLDQYRGLRLARLWRHVLLLWKSFLNFYLFSLPLVFLSLSSFLDPSRSISKLAPGKVSIVFLQKLPDQDTPVVTSHGLGRVGVGLPCCLCLSFPLISATT